MSPYLNAFLTTGTQPEMIFFNDADASLESEIFEGTVNRCTTANHVAQGGYYAFAAPESIKKIVADRGDFAHIRGRFKGKWWNGFALMREAESFGLKFHPVNGYTRKRV